ncbi:type III secretion system inner rod subunit SctI [Pseudomonas bijieensis]|uniref:EscI/YscI/HrpB family type III secretion system inner rod protein n=1 Tax=Pseudomonas bijieensis TaxID=2681983 RepID=A0A6N1CFF3_9PSED|nr:MULTISPECIES: type III secretion system inner rod subunit SctI [Pseudomonas]AXP05860.1 EscI/YscI/HrpB family type III secretion system inner rod protein [Pseudomonas fluorescens]MCD9114043.1 type III secretion system inner rod subunit SctI [Pseudomonas bijieensis]PWJ39483.1 type III secretion system major needle protein (YscF/MxiH/PrgI family) [Pseudomonas sp. 43mfcvi1.1]QIB06179.1 EscI/YscI/HrpB family type III secretion system inner rod protein [Pseudomonas fluorescens]QKS84089.1 EscI/Ysc
MDVHAIDPSNLASTSAKTSARPQASAETSDVSWFNAQMREKAPAPDSENNVAARIIDSLSSRSGELQRLDDRANRDMIKAVRTADPQDMLQSNRSLSSFHLESLMTAKIVSKGSQAIEKLTNLQ